MARFVALDVETANPWNASVCQVGAAVFDGNDVVDRFQSLIDPGPEQRFEPIHTRLHGITPERAAGQPSFATVLPRLRAFSAGLVVGVTFSPFSRGSLDRAASAAGAPPLELRWLDVMRVVRRLLPAFRGGFGLSDVAAEFRVPLLHQHDALEEAIATGHVLLEACRRAGRSVDDVLEEVGAPGAATSFAPGEGPLGGETIVFTGALVMVRSDATRIAEEAGASVGKGVTKATTLLVVGDQDLRLVGDDGKSSKHEKAEKLIAGGQPIRIIGESDFFALVKP